MDQEEKNRALDYLEKCDPNDPFVQSLEELFDKIDLVPVPPPSRLTKIKFYFRNLYRKIVDTKGFEIGLISFFMIQLIIRLANAFFLIFFHGFGWTSIVNVKIVGRIGEKMLNLTWIDWGHLGFSFLSAIFVFLGIKAIHRSKLKAYKMFERSVLISIFFIQGFTFYKEQFSALLGLFFNILILMTLHYIINREEIERQKLVEVSKVTRVS